MTEKSSHKIKAFVIEYLDSTTHTIPLDKITGITKRDGEYIIMAQGWLNTNISKESYEELQKYFEPIIIESRE